MTSHNQVETDIIFQKSWRETLANKQVMRLGTRGYRVLGPIASSPKAVALARAFPRPL